MKSSATKFLVCPSCKGKLDSSVRVQRGPEILEGTLTCDWCKQAYPILRGVPRFVQGGVYAKSFRYQWNRFRMVQLDSFNGTNESEGLLDETTGWTAADYRGQLVLDAGLGAGRFAEIVAKKGGEVVGVDLTEAVDAAYANLRQNERVHLVQADLLAMPFRGETFDLAYSIGALQHTPDPRAAFEQVATAVKKGGALAIYVHSGYGSAHRFSDLIRKVTTRLPLRLMFVLSAVAVPLYYVYRIPLLGKLMWLLFPISMHLEWRWRWLDTFDWYTRKYHWKLLRREVCGWFLDLGFADIEIFDGPVRGRGTQAAPSPMRLAAGNEKEFPNEPDRVSARNR